MFTGLVSDLGTVAALERAGAGARMTVKTTLAPELAPGDSVAVNGVCLTAAAVEQDGFGADVIAETLARSSLGALEPGARVNLELPLRAADRLGGHVVQGHVDGVGVVERAAAGGPGGPGADADGAAGTDPGGVALTVRVEPALLRYVVEKGSVALDGVSLTVAAVDDASLTVMLIPETVARTTLGSISAGAPINVEVDVLAKHVEKLLGGAPAIGSPA